MIDYKKNRIDYGEILHPPENYKLDKAIATTYSLDLFTLLCIPVALFYSKNLDGKIGDNRMDILDAIQKTSDSVKVYCQKGKIKVPNAPNKIISFVEDCVTEVLPPEEFASFHPKIWVIRFVAHNQPAVYRVIILSRNLTFDRSWDLAYFVEGIVGKSVIANTQPLVDYIKYLRSKSDFNESTKFLQDLAKVDFQCEFPFDELNFHPIGFKNRKNPLPKKFKDLLIVSPFVDDKSLIMFKNNSSGKRYLFSRKEELDKIHLDSLEGYQTYFLSEQIVDGEEFYDEGASEFSKSQNLHAKLFIGSDKNESDWYLGSANCSMAAIERNEEFLIHLKSSSNKTNVNSMKQILLAEDSGAVFFNPYERKTREPIENNEFDFRKYIFQLLKAIEGKNIIQAECIQAKGDNKFDIIVKIKSIPLLSDSSLKIKVSIYGRNELQDVNPNTENRFEGINLFNLSPFLHWSITHLETKQNKEFITKMDIELPPNRKDAIFRSLIENREKFFQFLQFLLGNDNGQIEFLIGKKNLEGGSESSGNFWTQETPILEELLIASSRNPAKIKEINSVIERLSQTGEESPIPPEFIEFWAVFKNLANG